MIFGELFMMILLRKILVYNGTMYLNVMIVHNSSNCIKHLPGNTSYIYIILLFVEMYIFLKYLDIFKNKLHYNTINLTMT